MSEVWARLEGQLVDDQFPLRRYLGSSDHSGVFLTESAKRVPGEAALKLVSVAAARAESQLARWHDVVDVVHPHLVRLFAVGRCNVGGLGNLYAVMEYADQDLAQLLQRRALTEEETREMLVPVLSALAFLHERKLALGRMKPSNILVVGEQLKLASDGVRPVGEVANVEAISAYDPPEARDGRCSTAGDVWALGVTICEALTRRHPLGLHGGAGSVVLPPDLPPAFREIVAWCLRRQPQDRPEVADIDAWLSGQHVVPEAVVPKPRDVVIETSAPPPLAERSGASTLAGLDVQASAAVASELAAGLESRAPAAPASVSAAPLPAAPRSPMSSAAPKPVRAAPAPAAPVAAPKPVSIAPKSKPPADAPPTRARPGEEASTPPPRRSVVPLVLGLVVVIAVVWGGIRAFRANPTPSVAPAAEAAKDDSPATLAAERTPSVPVTGAHPGPAPASPPGKTKPRRAEAEVALSGTHEVIPDVPDRARRTIRGHVRVSVRVIVEKDGSVFAALTEQRGPSRYFERLALDAAKKWTFPPAEASAQRLMLVKFDFTREGTTAQAVALK